MIKEIVIGNSWDLVLTREKDKPYFSRLDELLELEYGLHKIYPNKEDIFRALKLTPIENVKVIILGQDPYHNPGEAEGLAFSVPLGCAVPPSLLNIYKELNYDLQIVPPRHGNLVKWAERGALMLNTVLTVREKQPNSHRGYGWEQFTDNIISYLSSYYKPLVFILWGNPARSKKALIDTSRHLVIESAHPSPLSAYCGFFKSRPFSRANQFLCNRAIDWNIEDY